MARIIEHTKFVEEVPQPPIENVYDLDEAIQKYNDFKARADFWQDIVTRARKAGARSRSELSEQELVEIEPTEKM